MTGWIDRTEIVGEFPYQDAIAKVVAERGMTGHVVRVAVAEDDTVTVSFVQGEQLLPCGRLPDEYAATYVDLFRTIYAAGNVIEVPAQIFGGTEDKPHFGVWIGTDYAS